jgi:hypothetical protein
VLVGSTTGVIAVVGFVLAIFGVFGFATPFVCAIIAVVCMVLFRRTVGGA